MAGSLCRYTANTITSPTALRAALAEVRRREFACLPGHVHEDALGIAVPVRDGKCAVIAALAAIVPVGTARQAVTGVLATAALGISRASESPAHLGVNQPYRSAH